MRKKWIEESENGFQIQFESIVHESQHSVTIVLSTQNIPSSSDTSGIMEWLSKALLTKNVERNINSQPKSWSAKVACWFR